MNQNLLQLNDNYGVVSDENGNISIISKDNQEYSLQDILTKENEVEALKLNLDTAKDELCDNKTDIIFAEIKNGVIIACEIVLYCLLHTVLPIKTLLFLLSLNYIITKGILLFSNGTRIERFTKRKKLVASISKLESLIPELEKELCEMKEKTNYEINCSQSITSSQIDEVYQNLSEYMDYNIIEEPAPVRVLSLSRKK